MTKEPANTEIGLSSARARGDGATRLGLWVLGMALIGLVWALCVNPTPESDLFWQLRTGEWIVSHHRAPHADLYSWTRYGAPWVAHEWLSFVVLWLAFHLAGFGGLYVYTAAVVSVLIAVHYAGTLRRTGAPVTAFLLSAGAAVLCSPFFQPRPQLATYLFSVITLLAAMTESEAERPSTRRQWILVPMFLLWANLHAGVLVGVGILGIYTIGNAVESLVANFRKEPDTKAFSWTRVAVTIACFAATFATPYSYHVYENFLGTITNSTAMNLVAEWASPNFHQGYGKELELLLAVLAYSVFFTRRRRDPGGMLLLVILVHESLAANRNVPLLALLGTLVAAKHVQSALERHINGEETAENSLIGASPLSTAALLIAIAVVFSGAAQASSMVRSFGPPSGSPLSRIGRTIVVYDNYPENACAFIERERFPSTMRMFNSYDDGGFLIWRLRDHPVYIDSRADIYFGKFLGDYGKLRSLNYGWRGILNSHAVDFIVISASEPQAQSYLAAPEWALVYVDDADLATPHYDYGRRNNTLIFIRRTRQSADLIGRCRNDCSVFNSVRLRYDDWGSVR